MDGRIVIHRRHPTASTRQGDLLPVVSVEIVNGRAQSRLRVLESPVFLIGADDDCDLVLADPHFPEVFAYLYVRPESVTLRRLGDGPLLSIRGEDVEMAFLNNGDVIRTGPYQFRIHIEPRRAICKPR